MENIFNKFKKLSENQNLDDWIKENKPDIFKLKTETNYKWNHIAEDLSKHLDLDKKIRASVLTEKLALHYFLASPQPKKKYDY